MLWFYSASPTLSMRVFYLPFEDARDGFDSIFYPVKAMLATDHYINIVFESKLDPTYMWHLLDVLSHEMVCSCLESLPGKRSENVVLPGDLITLTQSNDCQQCS